MIQRLINVNQPFISESPKIHDVPIDFQRAQPVEFAASNSLSLVRAGDGECQRRAHAFWRREFMRAVQWGHVGAIPAGKTQSYMISK